MNKKVSDHYLGEQGRAYEAARQPDPNDLGYAVDFAYFLPFLKREFTVLDFGCGNGGITRHIQGHVSRVDAVEVNPHARSLAEQSGITVFPSIESIPPDNFYNVIVSNHVLEHVRDTCGTLESLRARLAPDGILVLKLPYDDANAAYQRRWEEDDIDHHLQTWTPRLLANLLRECGYSVRSCEMITSAWHPKLFPLAKFNLHRLAFWLLAVIKRRRQVFAVAALPKGS